MRTIDKMVEREVATQLAGLQSFECRRLELELRNVRGRVEELERQNLRNAERIRGLERREDGRKDYIPEEAATKLEALLSRLKGMGHEPR